MITSKKVSSMLDLSLLSIYALAGLNEQIHAQNLARAKEFDLKKKIFRNIKKVMPIYADKTSGCWRI